MSTIAQDLHHALTKWRPLSYSIRPMDSSYAKEGLFTHTVLLFALAKAARQAPAVLGEQMGAYLVKHHAHLVADYVVQKGYLNLQLTPERWLVFLQELSVAPAQPSQFMRVIEYASPNTNKPLHLGHLRNIFIGDALANLYARSGQVRRLNLINDRGIHICKSMLAYQLYGQNETPAAPHEGDALVGKYYVLFEQHHQEQYRKRLAHMRKEEAQKTPILEQAHALLQQWEAGTASVRTLWEKMNAWALSGMEATYARIGVRFDREYKESNHYQQGKQMVLEALKQGICYQKKDGSVWIDLTSEGLEHKLLLRKDGTSVYMTQDLGIAEQKYMDYAFDESYYVVGDEQIYHFRVLFAILRRLKRPYADRLYHIAYGMVDLPQGKMKSREGTVVDADSLLDDLTQLVQAKTETLGKMDGMSEQEKQKLYRLLVLGAIKYHLLRIRPSKRMLFDYSHALDLQGDTGVFIQYTYARIMSLLRRAHQEGVLGGTGFSAKERQQIAPRSLDALDSALLTTCAQYHQVLEEARTLQDPSLVAHYVHQLAQQYNRWYATHGIFDQEAPCLRYRLLLSWQTAQVIRACMGLLGIEMPPRM